MSQAAPGSLDERSGASPALELSLPDLPELHIGLGALSDSGDRGRLPSRAERWRERLGQSLPVLLMLVLALGSWWLVRNAPRAPEAVPEQGPSAEPDYRMRGFTVERFDAQGQLRLKLAGAELRHVPALRQLQIDQVRLQAFAPEGGVTRAQSLKGVSDDKARHVVLQGQARITTPSSTGRLAELEGERLELFPADRVLTSQDPVRLRYSGHVVDSEGLRLDEKAGRVDLRGKTRVVLAMGERVPASAGSP